MAAWGEKERKRRERHRTLDPVVLTGDQDPTAK